MSSITGKDPYTILTYPLSSVLTMGTDQPQIGFTYPGGTDPLRGIVHSNIPISNTVMSGALPYYEKNTMSTATLDYLQSRNQMQKMGMIPQLNQRPAAFTPPLFSYQNPPVKQGPNWVLWVIGGLFALVLIGLIVYFFYLRRRKK